MSSGLIDMMDPVLPPAENVEVESSSQSYEPGDDLLWRHLKSLPAFRALLRSVEARLFRQITLPAPVLDLGCGDGNFAALTFDHPISAGIDPWWGPLKKASRTGAYQLLVQGTGDRMPFSNGYFASVYSNSVLEHIPNVQAVLHEVNRILQTEGVFVFTTPSHLFTEMLGGARLLERIGLGLLSDTYRRAFNFISRHARTESPGQWSARLAAAGFVIERWQYYFSSKALWTLELGHVHGLPSAILHALTGHWILAPWQGNLRLTERWVRPYFEEPYPQQGTMLLFITRKVSEDPVRPDLPPAKLLALSGDDD
jgi:SAM-dependent methyltransferase